MQDQVQAKGLKTSRGDCPGRAVSARWIELHSTDCIVGYFRFKTVVGEASLIDVSITISFPEFLISAVLIAQPCQV